MNPGFYKVDQESVLGDATLMYAPNFVLHKDYELRIENYDQYTYPEHGWYYFSNKSDAINFFEDYYILDNI